MHNKPSLLKHCFGGIFFGSIATGILWFITVVAVGTTVRTSQVSVSQPLTVGPFTLGTVTKMVGGGSQVVTIAASAGFLWLAVVCVAVGIIIGAAMWHRARQRWARPVIPS